jgi:glycosyltransferase involved in cell wall biosynthesis
MTTDVKKNNILCIYTQRFPYGKGETFFETELPFLSKAFKKIYILPETKRLGYEEDSQDDYYNLQRFMSLPANCTVIDTESKFSSLLGGRDILRKLGFKSFIVRFSSFLPLLFSVASKDFVSFGENPREFVFTLFKLYLMAKESAEIIKAIDEGEILHYSYMMYERATILSILNRMGVVEKFIARGHGNDIYRENYGAYSARFRRFELARIERLFTVSKHMKRYISVEYPQYDKKITTSYLGVGEHRRNPPFAGKYRVVTVSNVIPLKRVDRMLGILEQIDIGLEWIHFGSGPLLEELKKKADKLMGRKKNIKILLPGRISNSDLIEFYGREHVSIFMNLSLTEGLPVSIMEALSVGIPIIATNVGGTAEAIPDKSFLLKKDFDDKEAVKYIYDILNMDERDYLGLRERSFALYKDRFSAERNYAEYIHNISNL